MHAKRLLRQFITASHHRPRNPPLRYGSIPLCTWLILASLRIFERGYITSGKDIGDVGTQLVIYHNPLLMMAHREGTPLRQLSISLGARTGKQQLTRDHLLLVRNHSCDYPNTPNDTYHLCFHMHQCTSAAHPVQHHLRGVLIEDIRHKSIAAN